MSGPELRTSTPGMDAWRPNGDHLTYSEAAWLGVAWGIAMHAILNFFSVLIRSLENVLVVFAPAERLAAGLAGGADPIVRWLALLASLALFWALASVALLAAWREVVWFVRVARERLARGSVGTPKAR